MLLAITGLSHLLLLLRNTTVNHFSCQTSQMTQGLKLGFLVSNIEWKDDNDTFCNQFLSFLFSESLSLCQTYVLPF